jgi:hypothetical protein
MWLSVHSWESSPIVGVIGSAAALLAAIGTVWGALYASRPRRAIAYSAKIQAASDSKRAALIGNFLPSADEQHRAVIVTFIVRGTGRQDVPTSAFDNAIPITFSVRAADIRGVVDVDTRWGGGLAPMSQVHDGKLEVGPGLIGRNQVVTYTLVAVSTTRLVTQLVLVGTVDLSKADVALTSALIDTKLRTDKADVWIKAGVYAIVSVFLLGSAYALFHFTGRSSNGTSLSVGLVAALTITVVVRILRSFLEDVVAPRLSKIIHGQQTRLEQAGQQQAGQQVELHKSDKDAAELRSDG